MQHFQYAIRAGALLSAGGFLVGVSRSKRDSPNRQQRKKEPNSVVVV